MKDDNVNNNGPPTPHFPTPLHSTTGTILAKSRGSDDGNVDAGHFYELAVGHSLASWQEIARPLLSGDKEFLTLALRLNLKSVDGRKNVLSFKSIGSLQQDLSPHLGEALAVTDDTKHLAPDNCRSAAEENGYGSLPGVQALVDFQLFDFGTAKKSLVATAHPIRDTCNCKVRAFIHAPLSVSESCPSCFSTLLPLELGWMEVCKLGGWLPPQSLEAGWLPGLTRKGPILPLYQNRNLGMATSFLWMRLVSLAERVACLPLQRR